MMQLTKIGKYELLDRLGRGTSADVYLAKDTLMGRQVALKVVEPETADLEPFFKEARLLAHLQHPNIVTVHGSDFIDGKVIVDMELVKGKTLRQLMKDEKQLSPDRTLKIIAQILNALVYAHSMGVIHRDIKPANVLIGAEDAVKVVDFGIADVLGTQGYLAGAGTFSHMAPECFLDKSDKRSDIYSVGVILYEMLTGQLPFQAASSSLTAWKETLDKQEKARPLSELLPNAPNGLQGILSLALAYDKQKRFQVADAFLDALKRNSLYLLPNTEAELRLIDRFEAAYNRVDKHLRQELNADRRTGFADVVREYAQQHPEWQNEQDLLKLGRVRNKLRHEFTEADQLREVPSAAELAVLEQIAKGLEHSRDSQTGESKPQEKPVLPTPVLPPVQPSQAQRHPVSEAYVVKEAQGITKEQQSSSEASDHAFIKTEARQVDKGSSEVTEVKQAPENTQVLEDASSTTPPQLKEVARKNSPVLFEQLAAGISVEEALEAFLHGCKSRRDTLFAPEGWIAPRLMLLRTRLSNPITADQATALRKAVLKEVSVDTVTDWLSHKQMTWAQYQKSLATRRLQEEQRQDEVRQHERQEREKLLRVYASDIPGSPLQKVTGSDVLNVFYEAWARCYLRPQSRIPGGGMGDMLLASIREEFAKHFIIGVKNILADNKDIKNLSTQAKSLNETFSHVWSSVPLNDRRYIVRRLWREYLLPKAHTDLNIGPDDAEGNLDLREFLHRRNLPLNEHWRYDWLPNALADRVQNALKNSAIRFRVDYGLASLRTQSSNPISVLRGSKVTLRYQATSDMDLELPIWFGASLEVRGQYFYNLGEDAQGVLVPGNRIYQRFLSIARDWPPGQYNLHARVYYGITSHPNLSIPLMQDDQHPVRLV